VGYGNRGGRDGGRGRGSGTNNGQKMNQYKQFSDTEFEDAAEEASHDDDEDDEDETAANEGANQHKTGENGRKQITVSEEGKKDADAYDDFITEEEMQNKQKKADNTKEDKTAMVGVVTEIQKKRALSIDDEPTKAEAEKAEADKAEAAKAEAERAANAKTSVILDYSKKTKTQRNHPRRPKLVLSSKPAAITWWRLKLPSKQPRKSSLISTQERQNSLFGTQLSRH
jgi:hypothetical protein